MKTVTQIECALGPAGINAVTRIFSLFTFNNVNTLAINLSDTNKTLRIIPDEPVKATSVIKTSGFDCSLRNIIACEIPSHPGAFEAIFSALDTAKIPLDYAYHGINAIPIIFLAIPEDKLDEAWMVLKENWITIFDINDILF